MKSKASSVLFVTTSFPRFKNDFAGSFIHRFAKYLVRDGVKVTVLAPHGPGLTPYENMDGISVERYKYFLPRSYQCLAYGTSGILSNIRNSLLAKLQVPLYMLATIFTIIRNQNNYDVIHCHWLPTAIAAIIARLVSSKKTPIVLTNWGSDTRILPKKLTRWTIKRIDGCISTAVETDEHLKEAGCKSFRRIMAPIDEERFNNSHVPTDLRIELDIPLTTPVIPFIGRLDEFKDPITFIHACSLLKDEGINFIALIAGDGDLMDMCSYEINNLSLHNEVILLGLRNDPERLLKIATATVHISPIENTWANSIAEAMFMEVPVVLTDVGYTQKTFTHLNDCFIIPPKNANALKNALKLLIENDDLRHKIIAGANQLLHKNSKDSVSIVQMTRKYYDELFTLIQSEKNDQHSTRK
ncbi:glycosyltransferase family 4 protein [Desulforhopalus sp. 52FAK]